MMEVLFGQDWYTQEVIGDVTADDNEFSEDKIITGNPYTSLYDGENEKLELVSVTYKNGKTYEQNTDPNFIDAPSRLVFFQKI